MKKPLSVWLYGELAGYLDQNEEGKLHFEYSENAKYRLSCFCSHKGLRADFSK